MKGLSICIPTYNRLPHLKLLLQSIFNRFGDYPYEIIVADGGSTDGTIEYLKGFKNITLIEQKELKGSVKAYNACFKLAKNKYIYWPPDDFIVVPEVLIKACRLMDEHEEIAIVAPKIREPNFGNIHGVELFGDFLALSKMHIFRASALKEVNYLDENFRTYGIDDDSCLAILNLGYAMIFTREVGAIHNRVKDELWNLNQNIMKKENQRREREYLRKKWQVLNSNIEKYLKLSPLSKYRLKFFRLLCRAIFKLKLTRFIPENYHNSALKLYDRLLGQCVILKAKEYEQLEDFYLGQKIPKEILINKNSAKVNELRSFPPSSR